MTDDPEFFPNPVPDLPEVEALLDLCFGPARQKRTASLLRQGARRIDSACFLVRMKGEPVGSVECWELQWRHGRRSRRLAMLGPLATHPGHRDRRIGSRLMEQALAELDRLGLPVMLIGDEPYYGRWGFSAQHTGGWAMPGPVERSRLLLRARAPQRFAGAAMLTTPAAAPVATPVATTRSAA